MIRPLLAQPEANWVRGKLPRVLTTPSDVLLPGILPQTQEQYLRNHLQECVAKKDIASGRFVHILAASSGLDFSYVLGDQLIRFFTLCGTLLDASLVFSNMKEPNLHVWHAIISAYAQHGQLDEALALCHRMYGEDVYPNEFIFPIIFKACGSLGYLEQGKLIHTVVTQYAFEFNVVVGSSLVDMYIKFEKLEEAQRVFDCLKERNVVSWSSIIDGHAQHGDGIVSLKLFERMCGSPLKPDKVIFLCVLKACGKVGAIGEGLLIHDQIIKAELDLDVMLGNTLVDMYAKCKELRSAHKLFEKLNERNAVSWGALITGYAQNGCGDVVLELYEQMEEAYSLNEMILPCVLKACANSENLMKGMEIHKKMVKCRMEYDVVVRSSLVDMYAKCGSLDEAQEVFNQLLTRNLVSWGAMIGGYMQQGKGRLVLEFFKDMLQEGFQPDNGIFICVLKACVSMGALKLGRLVHHFITESMPVDMDTVIEGALVDMYAKCGSVEEAQDMVAKSLKQSIVLWGAVIAGYARHGDWRLAWQCLDGMQREGTQLNEIIYTSLLSAVSHAGEMEEGRHIFESMSVCNSITPSFENLTCMIDLLGSTGQLEEATHLLETIPAGENAIGWTSLMTACKTYGNVHLGQNCFHQVSKLEPDGAGSALMSSIYAHACMWGDTDHGGVLQISGRHWKKPGVAWIETNNSMEEFMVGDTTHCESPRIYTSLKRLNRVLKSEGYIPTLEGAPVYTPDNEAKVHEVGKPHNEHSFLSTS